MFERVEEKLKSLAVICAVLGVILGIILWIYMANNDHGGMGFVAGVCVAFGCLESCWVLYAFGEILEQQKETRKILESGLAKEIRAESARLAQKEADAKAEKEKAERERRQEEEARRKQVEESQKRAEQEKQARISAYWEKHGEEKAGLLKKKEEAENVLRKAKLPAKQKKELQDLIAQIDNELTKDRRE